MESDELMVALSCLLSPCVPSSPSVSSREDDMKMRRRNSTVTKKRSGQGERVAVMAMMREMRRRRMACSVKTEAYTTKIRVSTG